MAFHPNFANNGFFYLSYTTGTGAGDSVVSRFRVSATDPNRGDPATEVILLGPLSQNTQGHKSGDLCFGPGGMLYYSLGDGWAGGANVDIPFPHTPADNPDTPWAAADSRFVAALRRL